MNKKEIRELRRRWSPERSAVSRVYGCFINSAKEIVSELDESLGLMTQEEAEKYLALLKKSLSGTLGNNLLDIVFSTKQVQSSPEHSLLTKLRETKLTDGKARREFYEKVIANLDMGDSNYLLLMASDSYDVPYRGKDDNLQGDASEQVFTYFLCAVCPVKQAKPELGYFPGDNEFHFTTNQLVSAPELGFLFPAFDDRTANIYNALFYTRKGEDLHQDFIDAVFHTEAPLTAAEQKEAFRAALEEALEGGDSLSAAQAVHGQLADCVMVHKESRDPEPLAMTVGELSGILQTSGVPQERVEVFRQRCEEALGVGATLNPANFVDVNALEIKTGMATVTVDPAYSHLVKTQTIDGRQYILIPAEGQAEINGVNVELK